MQAQSQADKDKMYLDLYQKGVQAEAALQYLANFFPARKEQLLSRFKSAPPEQLQLIRELMVELDKIENDMKQAVLTGQRAIQKSLAK